MPMSKYFNGSGEKVAGNMKKQYGDGWQKVFYATANKRKKKKKKLRHGAGGGTVSDQYQALK